MKNFVNNLMATLSEFFTFNIRDMSDRQLYEEMMIEISEGGFGEIYQEEIDRRSKEFIVSQYKF